MPCLLFKLCFRFANRFNFVNGKLHVAVFTMFEVLLNRDLQLLFFVVVGLVPGGRYRIKVIIAACVLQHSCH